MTPHPTSPPAGHDGESGYIWSNEHNAYWRPDCCGYTTRIKSVGVYTRGDAEKIMRGAGPEKGLEFEPAAPPPTLYAEGEGLLRPRAHDVDEIVAHLAVAERQSLPSDDQIIMDHLRAALVLAQSLQRQLRHDC